MTVFLTNRTIVITESWQKTGCNGLVEIQYFGHSFFRIGGARNILIDAFVNFNPKDSGLARRVPCAFKERALKDVSLMLVTHEHFDHFDKAFIERGAKKWDALVVAHDSVLNELDVPRRQLVPVGANGNLKVREAVISAVPAHHPRAFYPLSYLIEVGGTRIFHAGDTDLLDEHEKVKADVAILPIGGAGTMDVGDAVKCTKAMRPKFVIPMSYNTFDHISADPREFAAKIEKSNLKTQAVVMEPGQTIKV